MITWGWTGMSHDASLAVFSDDGLEFAAHSERYSRIKNDKNLHHDLLAEALEFGEPDRIYFYENTFLKKTRQLYAGQYTLLSKESPTTYMRKFLPTAPKSTSTSHHLSHAAAGYYTHPFKTNEAAVLVLDSIGEWDTITMWEGNGSKLTRLWGQRYPHSLGIWYSAMTQRVGLTPQVDEGKFTQISSNGDANKYYNLIMQDFIERMPTISDPRILFKRNCHRGCRDWRTDLNTVQDVADIAAATQRIFEEIVDKLMHSIAIKTNANNLVLAGGCAFNRPAVKLADKYFNNTWVLPNPGDASSSIGCVLAHTRNFLDVSNVYSGVKLCLEK
jgi:carbamoyltransferase